VTPFWKSLTDRRMIVGYVLLVLGLSVTVWASTRIEQQTIKRARERFEVQVLEDRDMMVQGMVRYIHAFHGVHALCQGDNTFDERAWKQAVTNIQWTQVPGLLEIGYAEYVSNMNESTVPVRFISSKLTNSVHVCGYDMASEIRRKEALTRTGDYGAISATPVRVQLVTSDARAPRYGYVVFSPGYRYDKPGPLEVERRVLRGYAFAVFDEAEMWEVLFKRVKHSPVLYAFDGTSAAKELLRSGDSSLQKVLTIGSWGLRWNFRCVANASFIDPAARHAPQLALAGGAVFSLFLFFMVGGHVRHRLHAEATAAENQKTNQQLEQRVAESTAELRAANEQLKQSLSKELELGEMKTTFLSTVSHEFRTPLGIIVSSAGILDRYFDRLVPAQRAEHLQTIQQAAARMTELMEGALLFSKAEAGLVDFEARPLDLVTLCHRIVEEVQSSSNHRCPIDVIVTGDFAEGRGDERLLRTILINLLTNAVKYSPNGVPVRFQLCRKGNLAVFVVKDEGVGIPSTDLPKLFTPFQRGQNVSDYSGTGLGLVLVKKCVEIHQGKLSLDSKEGHGTTATLELPIFTSQPPKAAA
jgi:signal transduction histidine kinase